MNKKLKVKVQGSILDENIKKNAEEKDKKIMEGLFIRK